MHKPWQFDDYQLKQAQEQQEEEVNDFMDTKKIGFAEFNQHITKKTATKILDINNEFIHEKFINQKNWSITGVPGQDYQADLYVEGLTYKDWKRILKYIVGAHCTELNLSHMRNHDPKMVKYITQIDFPSLKTLYIDWAHLQSVEFLSWIDAPVLSQLSIIDCENFISAKSVVKMRSKFMNCLYFTNVPCKQFEVLSRVNLSKQSKLCAMVGMGDYNIQREVSSVSYLFKLQLNNKNSQGKKLQRLWRCLGLYSQFYEEQKRQQVEQGHNNVPININKPEYNMLRLQMLKFYKRFTDGEDDKCKIWLFSHIQEQYLEHYNQEEEEYYQPEEIRYDMFLQNGNS